MRVSMMPRENTTGETAGCSSFETRFVRFVRGLNEIDRSVNYRALDVAVF